MKKNYIIVSLVLISILHSFNAKSQCFVDTVANGYWGFNTPDPSGGIYVGYLCGLVDSVGTFGSQGYYNGDGYEIDLIAGSSVTFEVDQCNGNPVSLTVLNRNNDSVFAYSGNFSCPNSVTFIVPYTGTFVVLMNLNDNCQGGGMSLIGYVHAKITRGTTVPACPPEANQVNDTICGAAPLILDDPYINGNTSNSALTDPRDGDIVDLGYTCSDPNNTMWYSYTPDIDRTIYVFLATTPGSAFYSWLGVFSSAIDSCSGGLNYIDCLEGFDDFSGLDTVVYPLSVYADTTYYFMIDGYMGQTGDFSIRLQSDSLFAAVDEPESKQISVYPNPAVNEFTVTTGKSAMINASLSVSNALGEITYEKQFDNFHSEKISTSTWNPGIYFIRLHSSTTSRTTKVVVR